MPYLSSLLLKKLDIFEISLDGFIFAASCEDKATGILESPLSHIALIAIFIQNKIN